MFQSLVLIRIAGCLRSTALVLCTPRVQLSTLTLFAVLQKSPALVRTANSLKVSIEPATRILQKLTLTAASLGSYHALSGATTAVYSTNPEAPFNYETIEQVQIVFGVSNTKEDAKSWSVTGQIPPGLTISGTQGAVLSQDGVFNDRFGQITGSPTTPGTYTMFLKPWKLVNGNGQTAEALELTISVAALPPTPPDAALQNTPSSFIITWSIAEGQNYELQASDNPLDPNSWTRFPATLETSGDQQTATLDKSSVPPILILRVASRNK